MTFADTFKRKVEELDLERKLVEFADTAEQAVQRAAAKAGEVAHDNRDKVESWLDKVGATIDERTEGKYASTVGKVKAQVVHGVDRIAEQRRAASPPADAPYSSAPADAGMPTPSDAEVTHPAAQDATAPTAVVQDATSGGEPPVVSP